MISVVVRQVNYLASSSNWHLTGYKSSIKYMGMLSRPRLWANNNVFVLSLDFKNRKHCGWWEVLNQRNRWINNKQYIIHGKVFPILIFFGQLTIQINIKGSIFVLEVFIGSVVRPNDWLYTVYFICLTKDFLALFL